MNSDREILSLTGIIIPSERRSFSDDKDSSSGARSDYSDSGSENRRKRKNGGGDLGRFLNSVKYSFFQAVKVAKKLKANAVSGYSNDSNPFEDSNLTER
ncbi:hypothetical protein B296_00042756 [Ensete ventricosum]|uniref:Uncharacterized protein n=1 Tax=Ensete ventricosum TaxID=4639 RepID=A0A426Y465_ENSVE|nr:hypothetical protein B296_00042756 [Ensete ventricosum]